MRQYKPRKRHAALSLLALAALGAATAPTHAQTVLSGHYDNSDFGYVTKAAGSPYTVTPSATFNNNSRSGLSAGDATVTINGGTFNGNYLDGLVATNATVTVNGGTFSGNLIGLSAVGVTLAINGGTFSGNGSYGLSLGVSTITTVNGGTFSGTGYDGLFDYGSPCALYGGRFIGNKYDLVTDTGSLTLFGDFGTQGYGPLAGLTGSFTGRLQNESAPQTFTYSLAEGGRIILAPVTAPEPSSTAGLALGALALGGLALRARRCRVC